MDKVAFDPVQALLLDGLVFVVATIIFAAVMYHAWKKAKKDRH